MAYPPYGPPGGYYPGYPTGSVPPPPYGGGFPAAMPAHFFIRSRLNGLVLDIEGGNRSPGARVIMWNQKPGDVDNQLWYDHFETGTIRSKLNDFCITAEGNHMVVRPFVYGDQNQQWMRADPFIQHRYNTNRCLDIADNNSSPGAHLIPWDRHGGNNQQFDFVFLGGMAPPPVLPMPPQPAYPPAQRRLFYIASEMHGKVLDISGGSTAPGARVIVWPRKHDGSRNQLWYFDHEGVIRSALHDFALDAAYEGCNISVMPYTGAPHQRWMLVGNRIAKMHQHHECLDIAQQKYDDGAELISYRYKGSANQHWRLEYI